MCVYSFLFILLFTEDTLLIIKWGEIGEHSLLSCLIALKSRDFVFAISVISIGEYSYLIYSIGYLT